MATTLRYGSRGSEVRRLQKLLSERGYTLAVDGIFGRRTAQAVRAFQSHSIDQLGRPLVVDGVVGPLTWWTLEHDLADVELPAPLDYGQLPPPELGGSSIGRAALGAAIGEYRDGARETGGEDRGPWVSKYMRPAGLGEGYAWCAGFVSWCFLQAVAQDRAAMPFRYTTRARDVLDQFLEKGWAHPPESGYQPVPGDVVVWWRKSYHSELGHVGIVHHLADGILHTIEGNKSDRVRGLYYTLGAMQQLLGFGHVPDR